MTVSRTTKPQESAWQESTSGSYHPNTHIAGEAYLQDLRSSGSDFTFEGTEKCGRATCRVYRLTTTGQQGTGALVSGSIKVNVQSNRLEETTYSMRKSASNAGEQETLTTTFEYGITIDPIVLPEEFRNY